MILWLASYPKSGNTWVRTILAQIIYNNFDSEKVIETSKKIRLYPSKKDFLELDEDFKLSTYPPNKKKLILDKTISNWEISQDLINLNNKINIFKTHNMLCKIPFKDQEYAFTNIDNTIGVIHVVRDPRNVITSLINHFSFENLKSLETQGLFDENVVSKKTSEVKNFFNLGKENKWQNLVQTKTSNQIEKFFQNEMKDLGYI